jgi:DNA polymerase I-like protein with 3'-5' exonuclease and polymerase domains
MFTRYKIIRSFKELKQLVEACLKTGYASVDFETNGKGIYTDEFKPTILSVTFQVGSGCSIPLQHFDESLEWMQDGVWLDWLLYFGRNVIENPKVVKIAWNWKFDNQIFQKYHIYSRGTVIDGMLAKYLLNEERPNGLKDMVRRYLPEFADYEKYDKFETISWDKKPLEPLCKYGCMDTDFTFRLAMFLEKKLIDKGFYNLYRNLIMPASKVLQEAESNGLPFDLELNSELTEKYAALIKEVTSNLRNLKVIRRYEKKLLSDRVSNYIDKLNEEISQLSDDPSKARSIKTREAKISRVLAGEYVTNDEKKLVEPVNFNSQKQMVDLLYNSEKGFKFPILEYTRDAKTKKPTNNPSTSSETLEKLIPDDKTGFIKNLLDLRGLDKMNSTYILGLRELVQSDNRVHPTFLIHGCVSGNTKLIGKEKDIRIQDICPKEMGIMDVWDRDIWVLSHEGTWEQVTHTINKGKQPLYKITTQDGYTLKCTKEHKLLTPGGWKKVSYIFKHNLNVVMYDTSKLDITKPVVGKKYDEVIFRDIPGWDGYIASSEGKIYSVKVLGGRGVLDYNHPHELVPRECNPGRLRVYLRNNSKKKYAFQVSHLVWMAFNNELHIPNNMVIDHINCNTLDNRPENLQCITYSENVKRAYKYSRSSFTSNGINGSNKFNTLTISKILEDYQNGNTQVEICEKYDISQKQVSGIVNGQRRKDIYLTKLISMEYEGEKTIYDLSVNDKHSYVTRSNFINSNTTSGRLSSRNPNGQNIPKVMVNPDIKRQFITPPGKLFLTYDYSQAELRILAHLAKEDTMLEWFRTGKDIHLASACKKYHEDYDSILPIYEDEQHELYPLWKKRRKQAKTINFGIVYEQSAKKLAESLSTPDEKVSDEEGQVFLDEYFETFPKIKRFMDRQHKFMEKHGYCESLFGRRRRCPKVYSDNYSEYLEALRQSTNMPCQSAASDMALFASIIVYEKVKKGELPPMQEVNTVHDSVYQFIEPRYITPDTIFGIWDICRNPSTKKYFGFEIKDVDMSMDFTVGRTMAEELPYIPGYDYNKMLSPNFDIDEYYAEHRKVKGIQIVDYPKEFKEYFRESWRKR